MISGSVTIMSVFGHGALDRAGLALLFVPKSAEEMRFDLGDHILDARSGSFAGGAKPLASVATASAET